MSHKVKIIFRFFVSIVLLLSLQKSFGGQKVILDRLILEITPKGHSQNSYDYTQREMEIYLLVKQLILKKDSSKIVKVNNNNWKLRLKEFQSDMIIFLESQNLGKSPTERELIEVNLNKVNSSLSQNKELTENVKVLDMDQKTKARFVDVVLHVQSFSDHKNKFHRTSRSSKIDWFTALKEKYLLRGYEGANNYIEIYPLLATQSKVDLNLKK